MGIAHVSPDGGFLRINQRFCSILGYTESEMLARTFQEITHPDDLDADVAEVQRLISGESNTYSMDKRYICKNGSLVWINLTVSVIQDEAGCLQWFVSVDFTDQRQAEKALSSSEEKFRQLMEQAPLAIQIANSDGHVEQVNSAWMALWGISEESLAKVLEKYNLLQDEEAIRRGVMPLIEKAFAGEAVMLPLIEYDGAAKPDADTAKARLAYAVKSMFKQLPK